MDINPQILVELTKKISEQNQSIEKSLVVNNSSKNQFESYTIQLGSRHLIIDRPRNYKWSQEYKDQICETEKPLKFRLYPIQTPNFCRKIFNFKPLQNESKYDIVFIHTRYYRKTYIHDYTF